MDTTTDRRIWHEYCNKMSDNKWITNPGTEIQAHWVQNDTAIFLDFEITGFVPLVRNVTSRVYGCARRTWRVTSECNAKSNCWRQRCNSRSLHCVLCED